MINALFSMLLLLSLLVVVSSGGGGAVALGGLVFSLCVMKKKIKVILKSEKKENVF